ncbi:MAG: biotin--[acetyl-CoA-carboxylase] ligase, partial [Thermoanaerobaculia bacterium]
MDEKLSLICIFKELDSTNEFLENFILAKRDYPIKPVLLFAREQRKGKGRGGKSFYSPKGGIYFSILLPDFLPETTLPLKVGLFFAKKLKSKFKIPVKVKWPNDLIIDGKKFGGILIEGKGSFGIVGVGINLERDPSRFIKEKEITFLNKYLKKSLKVPEFYGLIENWVGKGFFRFIKKSFNLKDWERYSYFKKGDLLTWEEGGKKREGIYQGLTE